MNLLQRFIHDRRGSTAIMFGLMLLPAIAAVGGGLDYVRAATVRTAIQNAVDAAAIAAARDFAGASADKLAERARQTFAANYTRTDGQLAGVEVEKKENSVRVSAKATVKTTLMAVFRMDTMQVSAASEAAWGRKRIELALVLDNTGSMASAGKMGALKTAVRDLLTTLERVSYEKDAVKVSIVPFNTQVNVGTGYRNADWLTFDADLDRSQRTDRDRWRGCVADREQPYDTQVGGDGRKALYPAAECEVDDLARVRPLTGSFASLRDTVTAMTPVGYTNITIGAAWGLASLTPGGPLAGAEPFGAERLEKIMILLTDGDNTRNRFTTDPDRIDARTRLACDEIKKKITKLYTIRVIEGNAKLLRECATTEDMYHSVRSASELGPVFERITAEISGIRLTH